MAFLDIKWLGIAINLVGLIISAGSLWMRLERSIESEAREKAKLHQKLEGIEGKFSLHQESVENRLRGLEGLSRTILRMLE